MPRLFAIAGVVDLERLTETVFSFGYSRCRLIPHPKGVVFLCEFHEEVEGAQESVVAEFLADELREQLPGTQIDHVEFAGATFNEEAVNLMVAGYWFKPSDRMLQQIAEPLLQLCRGEA